MRLVPSTSIETAYCYRGGSQYLALIVAGSQALSRSITFERPSLEVSKSKLVER